MTLRSHIPLTAILFMLAAAAAAKDAATAAKDPGTRDPAAAVAPAHTVVDPAKLTWLPADPLPPGAQVAVVAGDLAGPGPYVIRLKFPAGYRVPPHFHPGAENVTVLSGRMAFGRGEKQDDGTIYVMGPGAFTHEDAGVRHWAQAQEESVVQVHGKGPFGIEYVNPADAPPAKPGAPAATAAKGTAPAAPAASTLPAPINDPATLAWGPVAALPPGAESVVLSGDPKAAGPFVIRFRAPAGYVVPPHWHPADENLTLLSGRITMTMGETIGDGTGHELTAGAFSTMPTPVRHYVKVDEPSVIQVHGIGPWGITYVNPADDPRNASAAPAAKKY